MMKRVYVNLGDLVLISERDFDDSKVDIIGKYETHQIPILKKKTNFPNITNLNGQGDDIEFDFEETHNTPVKKPVSSNYMADIPILVLMMTMTKRPSYNLNILDNMI